MTEPVMTDKDVINLVRKELERKIANYCKQHGIDADEEEAEAEADEDEGDSDGDDDRIGKRNPPKGEKSDILDINALRNSIGLRVVHKDSGLEYYLRNASLARQMVDLENPEGSLFQVDFTELEQDYKLG